MFLPMMFLTIALVLVGFVLGVLAGTWASERDRRPVSVATDFDPTIR